MQYVATPGSFPSLRMRRTRINNAVRNMIKENRLHPADLIWPIFVHDAPTIPISTMPGQFRYSIKDAVQAAKQAYDAGINILALFPSIDSAKKNDQGSHALDPNNIVIQCTKAIKDCCPEMTLIADIALDPYTSHCQDGVVKNGQILNDETVDVLVQMSLVHAGAGIEILAPSDMMDGRVGAIRSALEADNYINTMIMAYSCKYASSFYGPFRDAVGTRSNLGVEVDKSSYQMDWSNTRDAIAEADLDLKEGADLLMVKPGMPYLDVLAKIAARSSLPVLVYQVSGEYTMLKRAVEENIIKPAAILESLTAFKRAGARGILTYFALDVARALQDGRN